MEEAATKRVASPHMSKKILLGALFGTVGGYYLLSAQQRTLMAHAKPVESERDRHPHGTEAHDGADWFQYLSKEEWRNVRKGYKERHSSQPWYLDIFSAVKGFFGKPDILHPPEFETVEPTVEVPTEPIRASCVFRSEPGYERIKGTVRFTQHPEKDKTLIEARVYGLPHGKHGITIYDSGDISNGCKNLGRHYNPLKKTHGHPDWIDRHMGDMGNIESLDDELFGTARLRYEDRFIKLSGPYSVLGRAVAIHKEADDHGWSDKLDSVKTGNAGPCIACCVIGRLSSDPNYRSPTQPLYPAPAPMNGPAQGVLPTGQTKRPDKLVPVDTSSKLALPAPPTSPAPSTSTAITPVKK